MTKLLKNKRGLTFIEVIVSIFMMAIITMIFGTVFSAASLATGKVQYTTYALHFAQRTMEEVRVWNNAIFSGVGQTGKGINRNVDIRGSVYILGDGEIFANNNGNGVWDDTEAFTDSNGNGAYDPPLIATDISSDFSGTAYIGNNYNGMPATLTAKVSPLTAPDNFLGWGGENVCTPNTEVRVKHGKVNISGSATIGTPNATGNNLKETVDGMYVNDGYGGNQGATSVYSDNGTGEKHDLGDMIQVPSLYSEYDDPVAGTHYTQYIDYLRNHSYTVTLPKLDDTIASFTAGDTTNNITWNQATRTLTINGIVRINGDLDLARKNNPVNYQGNGTFFAEGDIRIHGNFLPKTTFPTTDVVGLIAREQMGLATGSGESQIYMAGAFYAEQKIVSAKQNQIAGIFVSSYFDMGTNVPNIYQVPTLADHLPSGMPDKDAIWVKRIYKTSWREM
ncbi:MAG: prepilin-type N-terminal cleavage/methylation domain-containing protein [Armatimonadetes bacterium]|nr:prepilin-type N-terminal cleavage/methylation domain-containing protein [Armatimonadota bacterium]